MQCTNIPRLLPPFPCLPSLLELIISQIVRHLGNFDDRYYLVDIVEELAILVHFFFLIASRVNIFQAFGILRVR